MNKHQNMTYPGIPVLRSHAPNLIQHVAQLCLATSLTVLLTAQAPAQTALPHVASVVQSGGQRGNSWDLTVSGPHIGQGTALVIEGEGVTVESVKGDTPIEKAPLNAPGKLVAHLKIAPDAAPGRRAFRVVTPFGASDPGYFVIGIWPETARQKDNTAPAQAQKLTLPVTVVGTIGGTETHWFSFHATSGQAIVCEPFAERIGSALQPVLSIQDATGHELAATQDFSRIDSDLTFTAPTEGDYLLSIRDMNYRGGDDHNYRLTVGAIPYVVAAFPPGGRAGSSLQMALTGVNLGAQPACTVTMPAQPTGGPQERTLALATGPSNSMPLMTEAASDSMVVADSGSMQSISAPSTVYGRIQPTYRIEGVPAQELSFAARQGEHLRFSLMARALGSRLTAAIALLDSSGKRLATGVANGDTDPSFDFTAPQTAAYRARITDLSHLAGPDYFYRLDITTPEPDFHVTYTPDRPAPGRGGTIPMTVTVERLDGFDGDVDIAIEGLPAGVQAAGPMRIPRGRNDETLVLTCASGTAPSTTQMQVTGTATINGKRVRHTAGGLQEFYERNNNNQIERKTRSVPLPLTSSVLEPDIVISPPPGPIMLAPGKSTEVVMKITRGNGFTGKSPLTVRNLPAGVTVADVEIPEKQNEAKLTFKAEGNAALGDVQIVVVGSVVFDELNRREYAAVPVTLSVHK
jgi:hypothetical protein